MMPSSVEQWQGAFDSAGTDLSTLCAVVDRLGGLGDTTYLESPETACFSSPLCLASSDTIRGLIDLLRALRSDQALDQEGVISLIGQHITDCGIRGFLLKQSGCTHTDIITILLWLLPRTYGFRERVSKALGLSLNDCGLEAKAA